MQLIGTTPSVCCTPRILKPASKKIALSLVCLGTLTGIIFVLAKYGVTGILIPILNFVDEAAGDSVVWSCVLLFSLQMVIGVFFLPGISLASISTGFVLGFSLGLFVSLCATFSAAALSFWVGRRFFKDKIHAWIRAKSLTWMKFLEMVEARGLPFLLLFRLMAVPVWVKNYGPSVLNVSWSTFLLSVLLVSGPFCVVFSLMGSSAKSLSALVEHDDPSAAESASLLHGVMIGVSAAVVLLLSCWARRMFLRAKASVEEEERESRMASQAVFEPLQSPSL